MTRLVIYSGPAPMEVADGVTVAALAAAPPSACSVSARIAYGLALGEELRLQSWPAGPGLIELRGAGLDLVVAISAALPSIPVEGASVDVQWSAQGKADAETPFGREVVAKFVAQLEARGAGSVSC